MFVGFIVARVVKNGKTGLIWGFGRTGKRSLTIF